MSTQSEIRDPQLESLDVKSLSEQVYDHLADQIIGGEIGYGDKLNIRRIANTLNVSTIPIRDALKRLEQEGIVTIRPRCNCFVRTPRKRSTLAAIDSRRMLELFAVRSFYDSVEPGELVRLEEIIEKMRRIVESSTAQSASDGGRRSSEVDAYVELDRRFHTELCGLAGNDYINRFYREVSMHLSMSNSYGIGVCHGIETTFQEHEAIVSHLRHNSPQAVDVLESHLLKSKENILKEQSFRDLPN